MNGSRKAYHRIWRSTPTRTVLNAKAGEKFQVEVRFKTVKTWGAGMKINIARELPIDYQQTIAQLKGIDKVVFVGGIAPSLEGEEMPVNIEGFKGGDRTNIELPKVQRDFLKALKAAGKQVIFVNCSGSAIALEPEMQTCDAIVQAWYPGQEGGTAVADVLFGDVNLPDYEDYSMKGRTYRYFNDALFPFGYGLSYTTFEVDATTSVDSKGIAVNFTVENTGKRDGTEIVQVYIRNTADKEGPLKTLRAFKRVDVKAGKTVNDTIRLNLESFEGWDSETNTMRFVPGTYEIFVGNSSKDEDLQCLPVTIQ